LRASEPWLSVVLVTPERLTSLHRTLRHLQVQAIASRIELIIVAPDSRAVTADDESYLAGFGRVAVVPVGSINNVDVAAAGGVLRATAPVVALIEDHAFPQAGWAEAIVRAHAGPWAAVGATMVNANPRSMLSWTNLLLAYGWWTEPVSGGEVAALPGHNIAYKTALLQRYGDRLREKLGRAGGLLDDLKAQGGRLYLAADARIAHVNPSRLRSTVTLRFNAGRLYAATRACGWSASRRWLYVLGGPLIPFVRFRRLWREFFGQGRRSQLIPHVVPALLLGLILDALGQMAGYARGVGRSIDVLATFEMDRWQHLTARDHRALAREASTQPEERYTHAWKHDSHASG